MNKDKVVVNGYKTISWLLWKLPQWFTYPLAAVGGEFYYWLNRNHSHYADLNLQIVLGEPSINRRVRQVARRSFRNYVKYMIDFLRQPHLTIQEIAALITSSGWEYITEAQNYGKGVMLISPHFGNWDGAAAVATAHGYTLSSVAKDFDPPELNELLQGARRAKGIKIYSLKDSMRGLVSTLKANGMVVLLLDSPLQNEGIVVNFFGRPVRFAAGPGTLVYMTGAKVVLGYMARQPGNRTFYGCWEPVNDYELTGERDHDIKAITQGIANEVEKLVRRHPDQWYMFHSIFLSDAEYAEYEKQQQSHKKARRPRPNAAANLNGTEGQNVVKPGEDSALKSEKSEESKSSL
jgi:KDO2-lipid IV(A) lauroyltransferase